MNFFVKILQIKEEKCYNNTYLKPYGKYENDKKVGDVMMNVIDLSKYIVFYYNENKSGISNLKLQKMLYYIQGYSLKFLSEPAFDSRICNWPYGPVVEDAYFEFNVYGSRSILLSEEFYNKPKKALEKIVLLVLEKCIDISAFELVTKTHSEAPWQNTQRGDEISVEQIHDYFCKNNPLNISFGA